MTFFKRLLFLLCFCATTKAFAQVKTFENFTAPKLKLDAGTVLPSNVKDTTGRFSYSKVDLALSVPLFKNFIRSDPKITEPFSAIMLGAKGSYGLPDYSGLVTNPILYDAALSLSGFFYDGTKSFFTLTGFTRVGESADTYKTPELQFGGLFMYKRTALRRFNYKLGAVYSFAFGSGRLFPLLGFDYRFGDKAKLDVTLPLRISFSHRVNKTFSYRLYSSFDGGIYRVANESLPSPHSVLYLQRRDGKLGADFRFRVSRSFSFHAEGGAVYARRYAISDSRSRSDDPLFQFRPNASLYGGVGVAWSFRKKDLPPRFDPDPGRKAELIDLELMDVDLEELIEP